MQLLILQGSDERQKLLAQLHLTDERDKLLAKLSALPPGSSAASDMHLQQVSESLLLPSVQSSRVRNLAGKSNIDASLPVQHVIPEHWESTADIYGVYIVSAGEPVSCSCRAVCHILAYMMTAYCKHTKTPSPIKMFRGNTAAAAISESL